MSKIAKSLIELVGNTPLVELSRFNTQAKANLIAKVEYFNPAGSVKDRVALAMIEDAERRGVITKGATIIEPTSGNTGVGLALASALKGYRLILTMPETMSIERRMLVRAYGAEVVLTPGAEGMKGAIAKAEELHAATPNSFIPLQFNNTANSQAHYRTTGQEIWSDTDGKVDVFVAGVGTGGTVSGVGRALKEKNPDIYVVAVEPDESAVLSGEKPGPHKIQGIGAGFVPKVYEAGVVDEVIRVKSNDAIRTSRQLAATEGLVVGISSGASAYAALQLSLRERFAGKNIVALLPDTGERYLSTVLYAFEDYPL